MNPQTHGERLFERYLRTQNLSFIREPRLAETTRLVDYAIDHPSAGKILFEVKDIHVDPPRRSGAFDPHSPIDAHISAATRKFKDLSEYPCVIVFVAGENSFVDLTEPYVMLGAMYGRWGWTVPIPDEHGRASREVESGFIGTDGKMSRPGGPRNRRVSALISLMNYNVWSKEAAYFLSNDDGRSRAERAADIESGRKILPENPIPCVTVWENGFAARPLPRDLFRGEMDAWWAAENGELVLSMMGERRARLKIDR